MFQGKISAIYLDSHCTQHSTQNEIIPDILIHNYSRTACPPAIIDLQILQVDKNQVMYTPGMHEGRAIKKGSGKEIRSS